MAPSSCPVLCFVVSLLLVLPFVCCCTDRHWKITWMRMVRAKMKLSSVMLSVCVPPSMYLCTRREWTRRQYYSLIPISMTLTNDVRMGKLLTFFRQGLSTGLEQSILQNPWSLTMTKISLSSEGMSIKAMSRAELNKDIYNEIDKNKALKWSRTHVHTHALRCSALLCYIAPRIAFRPLSSSHLQIMEMKRRPRKWRKREQERQTER